MEPILPLDPDTAWAAFAARDRAFDGRFVVAVKTTGIYCRPSCPARHTKPANVAFYADPPAARAAGYRACKRCAPDGVSREEAAVAQAIKLLDDAEERVVLGDLAAAVGYAPHHFQRLFTRAVGLSPAAYARARRASAAAEALSRGAPVTEAVYAAGYSAPSRFYADGARRLGMAPSAWARGGAGETIRWTIAETSLGPLLIAATDKGLCRIAFDESEHSLAARFPNARIEPADEALGYLAAAVVARVEQPGRGDALPLDVRGTAFQEAVWRELAATRAGETVTYAELAARAGRPGAARAAGSACGANPVAIVIPCHRARRGDGTPGGYAWGLARKHALNEREGAE